MIKIGKWSEDIHSDPEQVKRIYSGSSILKKITEMNYDKDTGTFVSATIKGSAKKPYIVTLDECSCPDYHFRLLPCKHIYALAFKLGMLDDLPKYQNNSESFNPGQEMERYKNLYLEGQISTDAFSKICSILGTFDPQKYAENHERFNPIQEIARYKQLFRDGQMSLETFVKLCTVFAAFDSLTYEELSIPFDLDQEIERYRQLYLEGKMAAVTYIEFGTALEKLYR